MKCNKLLSAILATAVTVSSFAAMSITANANGETTTKKTMNIGTAVISAVAGNAKDRDIIYYGNQTKWRVLSTNGNTTDGDTVSFSDGTKTVSKDKALFVISENDFGQRAFDSRTINNQSWKDSNVAKVWCNGGFYTDAGITDMEKAAILTTSKTDAASSAYKATSINDKVFYLSANEATTYFSSDSDRIFVPGGEAAVMWWLRSPDGDSVDRVGFVNEAGDFVVSGADIDRVASRPAFNLNPESVLFTSAADFAGGTVGEYSGNEWKLTLKDSTRNNFTASSQRRTGNVVTVAYTNAVANENVSCIITDKDQKEIKYYATSKVTSVNGTADLTIPETIGENDKMFVFSEQVNGAKKTNYASELKEVTITASAETTKKTMNFGSGVVSVRDNIYYGNQTKWRVLSTNGNTTQNGQITETATYTDDNGNKIEGPLFVISENDFGVRAFNLNNNQNWQNSQAQTWCNGEFYTAAGITTDTEKAAILTTSKTDALYGNIDYKACSIEDKVFYLSVKEAATYFNNDNDRKFTVGGGDAVWWLRSPYYDDAGRVGAVLVTGTILDRNANLNYVASRPAFNINPESVLFTSAAEGGKSSSGGGGGEFSEISAIGNYSGNEWKLTLKDKDRSNFNASYTEISEGKIKISYSNAKTGGNEKISYIVTDKDQNEIKYYGNKAATEESGHIEITPPTMATDDRLFVFNEQDNEKYKTNYASEPVEVMLPEFSKITANVNDSNMGSITSSAEKALPSETITLTATANEGYRFTGFTSDDVVIYDNINEGKGYFTMPDKAVTVTANFEPLEATHKITVISNYPQMGTASASVTTAKTGDVVTLSNTPENGNEFVEYISGDVDVEDGKFMMLDKDVTIIAKFKANALFKNNTDTPFQVQKNADDTALLRFMWGMDMADGAYIKNIGAYIIPWDLFDKGSMSNPSIVIIKEPDIKNGDTFSADHIGIPFEKYNTEYCAIPFVNGTLFTEAMIKGSVN